jgi:hypothetical protein
LLQAARRVLEGREPPHIITDASANDFSRLRALKGVVPANHSWQALLNSEKGVA